MTVIFEYVQPAGEIEVESTTWVEIATKSNVLNPRMHKLHLRLEYGSNIVDEHIGLRTMHNLNEVGFHYDKCTLANQFKTHNDSGILDILTEESHTFSLQARALNAGVKVLIRRIRFYVEQY